MCEAILSIYTVDKLIGYIMIGQFRTSDKFSHMIRRHWQILFRNDKLYKAFLKSPKFAKKNVDDILGLFSVLVNFIVTRHLITASGNSKILELVAYIDDHPELDLSLDQACEMVDMGISSFCGQFKAVTGKSFKSYVISRKLQKADELLTSHKHLKIHEIATQVGYSDPYLFSRVYKKHRRKPPISTRLPP